MAACSISDPDTEPMIQVARVVESTRAEGPGTRFAVWVQGCSIRCPGCFNPDLFTPLGGTPTAPSDLAARALARDDIEGVTLLGGEPFEQAGPLAEFAGQVRAGGLSVMTFSGHLREDLATGSPEQRALLAATDLLVDGPYDATRVDGVRPWLGSTNQRFHFLTDAYGPQVLDQSDRIEVRVDATGRTSVNGWADDDALDVLLEGLRRAPRERRTT